MIALSLRQPWAFAVVTLGKHIENRRWNTAFRGDFLIHASKGMTKKEYYDALDFCAGVMGTRAMTLFPPMAQVVRGGIVGAARIVDVKPPCPTCANDPSGLRCQEDHGWHMGEQYGFVLEHVRPAPRFVPCIGHLGFFRLPEDVAATLRTESAP